MFRIATAASLAVMLLATVTVAAEKAKPKQDDTVLDHKVNSLDGKKVDLAKYKGKVLLIVNVASECGLTPQYEDLQALHEKYSEKGLAVLGFPCNQFGKQEPGDAGEIRKFCDANYGVKFDLFEKIEVNGEGQSDLYRELTIEDAGAKFPGKIKWNFEKFIVGKDGKVVARFEPRTKPTAEDVVKTIETELEK